MFEVGSARVEVSQPRSPCWKLARGWQTPKLSKWVQESGFTGWYFRVLRPGQVRVGDVLSRVDRPHPDWTLSRANRVRYRDKHDLQAARELATLPALAASWMQTLQRRIDAHPEPDDAARLFGPDL